MHVQKSLSGASFNHKKSPIACRAPVLACPSQLQTLHLNRILMFTATKSHEKEKCTNTRLLLLLTPGDLIC